MTARATAQSPTRGDTRRLVPSGRAVAVTAAVVVTAVVPVLVDSDFWMLVLGTAGIFAIGAIGLHLLTGITGQVSLGHAAFVTIGAYTTAYLGAERGWPLLAFLAAATVFGGLVGLVVGPFALRFRGDYLVVVTLALIFVTTYVVENWESVTGGFNGISANAASTSIGPVDFAELEVFGTTFTRAEGLYYLAWLLVGLVAVIAYNLVRTKPGRAMQAIRDQEIAASVTGVSVARYKVAAFAISSAMAALAGSVQALSARFLSPNDEIGELFLSIRFVAMIVVGGIGSLGGAIVGALLIGPLPELVREMVGVLDFSVPVIDRPLVTDTQADGGIFSSSSFAQLLFGALLVVTLIRYPTGIAGAFNAARRRMAVGSRDRRDGGAPDTGDGRPPG